MRLRIYKLIFFSFFLSLSLVLFFVQVVRGGYFYNLSLRNSIRLISQDPWRGRILDRDNNIIADSALSFDAVIIPQDVKNKNFVFQMLSGFLSITPDALAKLYSRGYLNPFTPVPMAKGIAKTTAIALEEASFDLPGVSVELNVKRFYPHGAVLSHVLGYMGEIDKSRITQMKDYGYDIKDKVGYSGLEERFDIYLKGEKGGQQVEVDNRGRQVRLLGYKPPFKGKDVQLTIDLELQEIADKLLQGKRGAFVLLDVSTGAVLVMSSAPAFDPNVFVGRTDKNTMNYYLRSPAAPLFNRAVDGQFPPGSVFKVVTATAALKTKKVSLSTTFVCNGQLKVGNRYFKCWAVHGPQDFYHAMAHSCDVYFYSLGLLAGADGLTQTAHDYGLSFSTGIDLLQESSGFIPSKIWKRLSRFEGWYDGDTANFSIGQGYVLATPLQLARMMAVVGNGGYLVEPYLTQAIDGEVMIHKEPKKTKLAPEFLNLMKEALRFPVREESGTAHTIDVPGLEICGKTGTAQVRGQESHGWVAGFFPKSKPRYAFCIILENAGSSHYACQLGKEFLEEALRRKKI
jgi:penicillin-binding protein 2